MQRRLALLLAVLALSRVGTAQFASTDAFVDSLSSITSMMDETARDAKLDVLFDSLQTWQQIPFRHGAEAAFVYRGSGTSLAVAGDFNGWNPAQGPASRLGSTDVWLRRESFPADARLDYKFVRNGSQWILDPGNPLRQRGGFGDNSEIRMPAYVPSPWVVRVPSRANGSYSSAKTLTSTNLGYTVTYRVYTPPGYESGALVDLPVIYVTDGHEYADDQTGSMRIVLDNLIAEGAIEPVVAVFIDPRVGGSNRRASQYVENPDFAAFVGDELVPVIDGDYRTNTNASHRAILGTSLGGLNAAYFGAVRPDVFGLLAIQSPAFHAGSDIYALYRDHPARDLRIHMTWGTINDVGSAGERMADILSDKGYDLQTVIVNEGHSWGAWRALLDDALIYFWGLDSSVGVAPPVPAAVGFTLGDPFPNPSRHTFRIPVTLREAAIVELGVYDILGRHVGAILPGLLPPGRHELTWSERPLSAGVYFVRWEGSPVTLGRTLVVISD